ncbi:hypothetical protein Dda_1716 [Drechslerella dactyloides]|uniref:Transcription factor Iwr1 domain-containing protein n=1 Tax=Drechslerella dactyloides TaxID=74499 RepID=A0AAD6NKW0_DREDA|nr:hypothetical protein Dda_1716 [Drechslerella dactyloides]
MSLPSNTAAPDMALPPHTIRIKRRRGEDPVQTLLVESKRRRVDGEFCFILHDTVESGVASSVSPTPPPVANASINGSPAGTKSPLSIPVISTSNAAVLRDDDGLHPGNFNEATSSDREGRPTAADRRLPIGKREIKKAVSPARSVRLKKKPTPVTSSRHRLSESVSTSTPVDPAALSPTTKAEVRRYHLSKKMKIENGAFGQVSGKKRERGLVPVFIEGAGRVSKKRSALKIGSSDQEDDSDGDEGAEGAHGAKAGTTKKPQTHFREKAMLRKQRSRNVSKTRQIAEEAGPPTVAPKANSGLEFGFDSDELAKQLQDMVLDYISNQPELQNYPTSPKVSAPERKSKAMQALGGGVGGGTWADVEKSMDVDMSPAGDAMKLDSDGEENEWVYDVYFRQELKKSKDGSTAVTNGDYGVLVISNSDDEQWWYENDEDEESASDVWGSEDEDSNAEEYYKNDYPDEDEYDIANSDGDSDENKKFAKPRVRGQKKRGVWQYNSDGSYDLEREDDSD